MGNRNGGAVSKLQDKAKAHGMKQALGTNKRWSEGEREKKPEVAMVRKGYLVPSRGSLMRPVFQAGWTLLPRTC